MCVCPGFTKILLLSSVLSTFGPADLAGKEQSFGRRTLNSRASSNDRASGVDASSGSQRARDDSKAIHTGAKGVKVGWKGDAKLDCHVFVQ